MANLFPITAHPHAMHAAFEAASITLGMAYYRHLKRRSGAGPLLADGQFEVLLGCVFGAALGNKLVFWLEVPHLLPQYWRTPALWFAGQSMVGGLLGGLLGVELAKAASGIKTSTGDAFVFPVLFGLALGRVGCFVAGLADGTYGLPTGLPWGVDFGDGIPRHPTQLYEILFVLALAALLRLCAARLATQPGLLFKCMLSSYLLWRLLVDFLKPVPYAWPGGLSGIQVVCALALLVYTPLLLRQWARLRVFT